MEDLTFPKWETFTKLHAAGGGAPPAALQKPSGNIMFRARFPFSENMRLPCYGNGGALSRFRPVLGKFPVSGNIDLLCQFQETGPKHLVSHSLEHPGNTRGT